jgi:hypothetical protein
MLEIINKQQLAEYNVRPMGLEPAMEARMITLLCKLSDEELSNTFRKDCGINVAIVSAGRFMFKY